MAITLYFTPMTSSTRVVWALEEVGVPYDKVKVNLAEGQQRTPEFLAINPNGKVPAMVVDGTPVFESLAMLLYLAETYGVERGLYPAPGIDRLVTQKWMAWGSVTLTESIFRFLRNTGDRFPNEEKNANAAEAARKEIAAHLTILNNALTGRDYLVGSAFSFADLSLATTMPFLGRIGIDTQPYAAIGAWVGRCITRPALGRAMTA